MKKFIKLFCCVVLLIVCIIGFSSCNSINCVQEDSTLNEDLVDTIVQLALDETDIRLDDYIDINYFSNLQTSTKEMVDSIRTLSLSSEQNEILDVEDEQYIALTDSITNIFSDLSTEEYNVFKMLANDDADIANMIQMIENNFELSYDETLSSEVKNDNIVKLSAGVLTITTILSGQEVCETAIIAIKGAFNSMIAALKSFFVPNSVKGIIITASILVIATVVIVNWNKIKPVFNQIVNVFVDNAKKLANTVTKVFNNIFQLAVVSTTYKSFDDVVNKDNSINQRLKSTGKNLSQLKSVLASFLGVTSLSYFYNTNNKVLCIGRDIADTYNNIDINGYQNYADQYNYWSFWVDNYENYADIYTQDFLDICNDVLIFYCCSSDWDFILVTNPYYYIAEHLDTRYGGKTYATEISIIRNNGYNYFTNVSLSWNSIPYPGYSKESYFSFAGYRVSKSKKVMSIW